MEDRDSSIGSFAAGLSRFSGRVIILAAAILIFYLVIKFSFTFGRSLFYVDPAEAAPGTDRVITIAEEESIDGLAADLYAEGIITNELSFKMQGKMYNITLYPGEYTVNTSMTIKEILLSLKMTEEEYEEKLAAETAVMLEDEDGALGGGSDGE